MKTIVLVLLVLSASISAVAEDKLFKSIDVFELELAADTQISPDGSQVAYSRVAKDIMTDRSVSNIWIVDANGEHHRPLLSGAENYSSPRWSPSGDRLAYVSNSGDRGAQIHVRWMDTGQTAVLSNVRGGPSSLTWSPDGTQIAFEMFVETDAASLAPPPKAPEGAKWAPGVKVIDQMRYRADGAGYLEHGNSHLFVLSADGGSPRMMTSGDHDYNGPFAWSKDGRRIYFAANL
ncbi:MAG: PD40 domain-containing protein [Woeseiaceae bacterium]|nr:PD40 domain-containing protein [Woeseiaceae bacterium]